MRNRNAAAPTRPSRQDVLWLVTGVVVGALVAAAHLLSHPSPGFGAGVYFEIADRIVAHGYRLPETVPEYLGQGVPFAYPPLVFYASAVVLDHTAVDPVTLSRYAAPLLTVLYLVPYYFVARELLYERTEAGLATVLLAVTPPTLRWHLAAGGLVRTTAFLLALTGLYTGIRLFRTGRSRWLLASTLLFGLTILAHPVYTAFFALSYLLFYLAWDRSIEGLLSGLAVGVGGVVLSAPWWVSVLDLHGPHAFATAFAAAVPTGVASPGVQRLVDQFVRPLVGSLPASLFFVLSFAGLFYFVGRGRFVLPAWLVTVAVVIGQVRFQFVAGSMMAAAFLLGVVREIAQSHLPVREWRRSADVSDAITVSLVAVVLASTVVGVTFGATAIPGAEQEPRSHPEFMNRSDEVAMSWVSERTDPSATFVVIGDAAEWFPVLTDRTVLVGPWSLGVAGLARYDDRSSLYEELSACDTETCVTRRLEGADLRPDYLYVPKGSYTIGGREEENTTALRRTLVRSDRYRLVYENSGAAVFRVVSASGGS